jgi:acyl CoA:acetate/3-ketoacid CoA transferase alpha subunit
MLSNFFFKNFNCFSKICKTPSEAIRGIQNGSFIFAGGFGLCGVPMNLINAVR